MRKLGGILLSKMLGGGKVFPAKLLGRGIGVVARNPRHVVVVGKRKEKKERNLGRERKNMREVGRRGEVTM